MNKWWQKAVTNQILTKHPTFESFLSETGTVIPCVFLSDRLTTFIEWKTGKEAPLYVLSGYFFKMHNFIRKYTKEGSK